jgi:protocatechuate 3,4-dioxygenase beta subunit
MSIVDTKLTLIATASLQEAIANELNIEDPKDGQDILLKHKVTDEENSGDK